MIDGSEKRNPRGQLAFELQNNHVCEKRSKKSQPFLRILSTFKRSFSKKMGKTPNSLIIHLLGGDYCSIVLDSEPIRLLQSPRSLSVYILNIYVLKINHWINT